MPLTDFIVYLFAALFGLCIFSFMNVIIYRVPRHIQFVKGFSFCPACHHRLYPADLVPVFSWIFLRGKCRYCGEKISPRYMVVELMGAVSAILSLLCYGLSFEALTVFAFLAILTAVAFVDADTMEIPTGFQITVLVIALCSLLTGPQAPILERLIGVVCISLPMFLLTLAIPDAFGGGDIKLMAAAGFFLGWKLTLLSFVVGVVSGGIFGAYLLITKKKNGKEHMPFGPFLCVGMAAAVLVGNSLISWYLGCFGL